jgi:hypothetical protein
MYIKCKNEQKKVLEYKRIRSRRNVLKGLSMLPFVANSVFAKASNLNKKTTKAKVHMMGDLDDDLIIIKASPKEWDIEACHQMHNPVKFYLEGRIFNNNLCPGFIEYTHTHELMDNEILIVSLANEREEREPDKKLLDRTHYKSVPLYVNSKELISSVIPEKNDIDYKTWYELSDPKSVYNYYRLWENAVCNLGIIVVEEGEYTIELINQVGIISASISLYVKHNRPINVNFEKTIVGPIQTHPFAEMDGGVWSHKDFTPPNDAVVREFAAYYVGIKNHQTKEYINSPLPYPFPYINRTFIMACNKKKKRKHYFDAKLNPDFVVRKGH